MRVEVTITQVHIAQLIGVRNEGRFILNSKDGSKEVERIKSTLFKVTGDFGNVKKMYGQIIY